MIIYIGFKTSLFTVRGFMFNTPVHKTLFSLHKSLFSSHETLFSFQPLGLETSDAPLQNPPLLHRISKTGYIQAPFGCTPMRSINFLGPAISSVTSAWINSSPFCPHRTAFSAHKTSFPCRMHGILHAEHGEPTVAPFRQILKRLPFVLGNQKQSSTMENVAACRNFLPTHQFIPPCFKLHPLIGPPICFRKGPTTSEAIYLFRLFQEVVYLAFLDCIIV